MLVNADKKVSIKSVDIINSSINESIDDIKISDVKDSDLSIVARVKEGDTTAFDILIKKYRERLYCVVYGMTSNREDSMDIVQDAFIKAFKSINSFKGNSSFYTWIYRIAVNMTITSLKKSRLRRFFSFENMNDELGNKEIVESLVENDEGSKTTLLKELREKLNEALQLLSIEHRTVVVLHEIEGLSHSEIAEIVGTREGTVRTRLFYAKQQLKAILTDYIK